MKTTLKTNRQASRNRTQVNPVLVPRRATLARKTIVNHRQPLRTNANGSLTTFNPTLPLDGALVLADVLRDQFNGLNDDIQSRATDAELSAAAAALNADIQTRVTQAQLTDGMSTAVSTAVGSALSSSSNISNNVAQLGQVAYAYYDFTQMQQVMDKIDELINALRR